MTNRSTAARIAAFEMHAQHDSRVTTAPGRKAAYERFEAMVPADVTDPQERARRAECLRRAHYSRMGLASAKARQRKQKQATA